MKVEMWIFVAFCAVACVQANHINQTIISCDVRDTINISSGATDQEGRFHHDNLIYEKGMFAEFDFYYFNFTYKVHVDPHIRGCVCKLKHCVRICRLCDETEELAEKSFCVKTDKLTVNIDDENALEIPLTGKGLEFAILEGRRCSHMYQLDPESYPDVDKWFFTVNKIINELSYAAMLIFIEIAGWRNKNY
jgi:hypothetical protein